MAQNKGAIVRYRAIRQLSLFGSTNGLLGEGEPNEQ